MHNYFKRLWAGEAAFWPAFFVWGIGVHLLLILGIFAREGIVEIIVYALFGIILHQIRPDNSGKKYPTIIAKICIIFIRVLHLILSTYIIIAMMFGFLIFSELKLIII